MWYQSLPFCESRQYILTNPRSVHVDHSDSINLAVQKSSFSLSCFPVRFGTAHSTPEISVPECALGWRVTGGWTQTLPEPAAKLLAVFYFTDSHRLNRGRTKFSMRGQEATTHRHWSGDFDLSIDMYVECSQKNIQRLLYCLLNSKFWGFYIHYTLVDYMFVDT